MLLLADAFVLLHPQGRSRIATINTDLILIHLNFVSLLVEVVMTKEPSESIEVSFEARESTEEGPKLLISGVDADVLRQPEKIRQLMDLLELPEGTNARLVFTTMDVIVR